MQSIKTEYSIALERIRKKAVSTCASDVSELYSALRKEGKNPAECRTIIEHDIGDIYQKRTILACLPDECKDRKAADLGQLGGSAAAASNSSVSKQSLQTLQHRGNNDSESTPGDNSAGSKDFDPDDEKITVSRQRYEILSERERSLNQIAQENTVKLHQTEQQLKQEREIKIGLQETIENLKKSLEAKAVEDNLAKPKSAVSPPQQMKMDQYFQQFSDIVATAHNHNCPAACETWQKASTITISR
jgi:hypothetical protein